MDKVVVTLDKHGNTSAASIPLALDIAVRDGRIQKGQSLLFEGIGGGFSWGSVLARFTPEEVLGKKQNSDAEKNKPTYPALLGLEASKAEYENLYQQAFNNLKLLSVNTEKLQALTQKLQSRRF
jgi:hypothetical protein